MKPKNRNGPSIPGNAPTTPVEDIAEKIGALRAESGHVIPLEQWQAIVCPACLGSGGSVGLGERRACLMCDGRRALRVNVLELPELESFSVGLKPAPAAKESAP